MIQKYKSIDKILEFLRYLEDRDEPVRKENSACQSPTQTETILEQH
jgi:hypothetical protein